jgi:hypothetical protein
MHHSRALIVAASVALGASVAAPSIAQQRPGRAQPHIDVTDLPEVSKVREVKPPTVF